MLQQLCNPASFGYSDTMTNWPNLREDDFTLRDFRFASGETLPELRQHFITLGTPRTDAAGRIVNASLLIHNTTGTAKTWLEPTLAGELFGPGQPLDAATNFLIIPDIIGFGSSSKPSDGLRAKFPRYRLHDVAVAQHRLVTDGLNIPHLKLVMGLSLGGMLTWMFGQMFPDFMEMLVPVASQPGPMSGRNWIQRRINVDAIRNDPEWKGGDYETQPANWARVAPLSAMFTQSAARIQEIGSTREKADAFYKRLVENAKKGDANNRLYQIESTMDYDPSPGLENIKARLFAINFADDAVNPPELGVLEAGVARISGARCVVLPATPQSLGHQSSMHAALWKSHLAEFLKSI
jgi:homoserine O-acetyltransferase/O-succinyltransferase